MSKCEDESRSGFDHLRCVLFRVIDQFPLALISHWFYRLLIPQHSSITAITNIISTIPRALSSKFTINTMLERCITKVVVSLLQSRSSLSQSLDSLHGVVFFFLLSIMHGLSLFFVDVVLGRVSFLRGRQH